MGKKIYLIYPDVFDVSQKYGIATLRKYSSYVPLGILYLIAVLKRERHAVVFFDNALNERSNDKVAEMVLAENPDYVAFSVSFANVYNGKEIAKKIKEKNKKILTVFGGPQASHTASQLIQQPYVDYVIEGEGEETLVELLRESSPQKIKGLFSKIDGEATYGGKRPPIEDLDALPYPAWDAIDIQKYKEKNPAVIQHGILSSRGCPYQCTFCGLPAWLKKYRTRNPQKVVDEIGFLVKKYNDPFFSFTDDEFLISKPYVLSICKEIIKRKLKVQWNCNGRVDHVDEELIKAMKEAGCLMIFFGVESGSERILAKIKKGTSLSQIINAFKICKRIGIKTFASFMIGIPGEAREDIIKSFDLMRKLDCDRYSFQVFIGMPGCSLHEEILKNKWFFAEWEDVLMVSTPQLSNTEIRKMQEELLLRAEIFEEVRGVGLTLPDHDLNLYCEDGNIKEALNYLAQWKLNMKQGEIKNAEIPLLKGLEVLAQASSLSLTKILEVYLRYLLTLTYLQAKNQQKAREQWLNLKSLDPDLCQKQLDKFFAASA